MEEDVTPEARIPSKARTGIAALTFAAAAGPSVSAIGRSGPWAGGGDVSGLLECGLLNFLELTGAPKARI
jgi:hypothetical protein